jgi:hypothetical protein
MIENLLKEPKRKCGDRKIGGTYLVSDAVDHLSCISLPYNVGVCPCCFEGIKFSRGFKWITPNKLFVNVEETCSGFIESTCPIKNDCPLKTKEKAGIMWVGSQFYTPEEFMLEAMNFGVSKRIASVPNNFEIGKTWVFLAHNKGGTFENKKVPAIFYVFKPTRIEKIVTETQYRDKNEMHKLKLKGIIPIPVPDDDYDHRGTAYDRIHGKSLFE